MKLRIPEELIDDEVSIELPSHLELVHAQRKEIIEAIRAGIKDGVPFWRIVEELMEALRGGK